MDEGGFEKQRRNVIVSSVVIILYYLAGGSIEKFSGLGLLSKVERPEIILYFVWLMHSYFLYRFWLICTDVKYTYSFPSDSGQDLSYVRWIHDYIGKSDFYYKYLQKECKRKGVECPPITEGSKSYLKEKGRRYLKYRDKTEVTLPYYKIRSFEFFSYFYLAWKNNYSTNFVLPYILGIAAIFFIWYFEFLNHSCT